jgi:serine/threonine-protein kinase
MGAVWEAINERTGRKVALKLILHSTEDHRRRLLREARACGSLEHRNIVEIYDVGETERNDPFLIMQLLTGETLGDLLKRRRRIEPLLAARIGRDIASALIAAHDAKIVHRDLKPANIFLHREGSTGEDEFVIKVLDFGVAKNLAAEPGPVTATGMVVGSLAYMSPEQLRVEKDLDYRSDLWSLGVILFQMLVGVRPFHASTNEIVAQILTAPIPSVSNRVRHVPSELDAIVARCLERDRALRYQNAREIVWALSWFAEGTSSSRVLVNVPPAPAPSHGGPLVGSGPEVSRPMDSASEMRPVLFAPPAISSRPSPASAEQPEAAQLEDTTLPLVRNERRGRSAPPSNAQTAGEEPARAPSPTGTQILSPTAPVASWRLEMEQALAASRQAFTPTPQGVLPEALPEGGTVALPHKDIALIVEGEGRPAAVKTTAAPSVRPPLEWGPVDAEPREVNVRRGKRGEAVWLYVAIGVGAAAIAALAAAFGMSSQDGSTRERAASSAWMEPPALPREAISSTPSADPIVPPQEPPSAAAPPDEPTPLGTASVTAPPTIATPPPSTLPSPKPPMKSSPSLVGKTLPQCGKFIKTNCVERSSPRKLYDPKRP